MIGNSEQGYRTVPSNGLRVLSCPETREPKIRAKPQYGDGLILIVPHGEPDEENRRVPVLPDPLFLKLPASSRHRPDPLPQDALGPPGELGSGESVQYKVSAEST